MLLKIATMFIKTTFIDLNKVKKIRNCVSKCYLHLYFLIQQKLILSGEKLLMQAELKECVMCFIYFQVLFREGITVSISSLQDICDRFQGRLVYLSLHIRESPKRPILNEVKRCLSILDLNTSRSSSKGKHSIGRLFESQLVRGKTC